MGEGNSPTPFLLFISFEPHDFPAPLREIAENRFLISASTVSVDDGVDNIALGSDFCGSLKVLLRPPSVLHGPHCANILPSLFIRHTSASARGVSASLPDPKLSKSTVSPHHIKDKCKQDPSTHSCRHASRHRSRKLAMIIATLSYHNKALRLEIAERHLNPSQMILVTCKLRGPNWGLYFVPACPQLTAINGH